MNRAFNPADRLKSFRFAFRGLAILVKSQHNAWVHLLATAVVIGLGFSLGVMPTAWCLLMLAIVQVWVAEGLNTAIELLGDAVTLERHPLIGKAKDVAAGAVLIAALGSAGIGLLVFWPYL